jgi:hypothetical protein
MVWSPLQEPERWQSRLLEGSTLLFLLTSKYMCCACYRSHVLVLLLPTKHLRHHQCNTVCMRASQQACSEQASRALGDT